MIDVVITGNLTVIGTPDFSPDLYPKQAILSDVKAAGNNGGTSVVGWNNRTLNTVVNTDLVTLNANEIDFAINELGTYYIKVRAQAYNTLKHKIVFATSADSVLATGTSEYVSNVGSTSSMLKYILTVTDVTDEYRVRHYTEQVGQLGIKANNSQDEVYTQVEIIKLNL